MLHAYFHFICQQKYLIQKSHIWGPAPFTGNQWLDFLVGSLAGGLAASSSGATWIANADCLGNYYWPICQPIRSRHVMTWFYIRGQSLNFEATFVDKQD